MILVTVSTWLSVSFLYDPNLHIISCDVGQGDAILIYQKNTQILVDGGPDNKIISCLGKHLPFWDRKLELVILTHPQLDHFGGLTEVFERYEVDVLFANSLDSSSQRYQLLKSKVGDKGIRVVNPTKSLKARLGKIYLDILNPPEEFLQESGAPPNGDTLGNYTSKRDPNDFSIVTSVSFGNFDAILTGDIGPKKSEEVANTLKENYNLDFEYIKIPHHGSKNGLSAALLEVAKPEIAVISVGKGNRYGHPNQEILDMLNQNDIKIVRTDQDGEIEIVTDGNSWWTNN